MKDTFSRIRMKNHLLTVMALLMITYVSNGQIISNAGFESWPPGCPVNVAPNGWINFSTSIGPDQAGACKGVVTSYQGLSHMNLVWADWGLREGAKQAISGLVVGNIYQVSFYAIHDRGLWASTGSVILNFYQNSTIVFSTPELFNGGAWTLYTLNFTALASTDTIGFQVAPGSTGSSGSVGVDSVTLSGCISSQAGTLTALRDTICAGTPASLSVTGNTAGIQWQNSVTQTNFTTITGANGATYVDIPSQTTYYRVFTGNGECGDTSAAYKIFVRPSPVAKYTYDTTGLKITFNSDSSSGDITGHTWDFGDSTTSSIGNPVHTFSRADSFHVCLTVFNGSNCSFTICKDIKVDIGTNAEEAITESKWSIAPNPATCYLNVTLPSPVELTVTNLLGQQQVVSSKSGTVRQIDVTGYPDGIYFLHLQENSPSTMRHPQYVKFVVQH